MVKQIKELSDSAIFVHRDRDYLEPDEIESWKKSIREIGAEPFVTSELDIEGYFADESSLQAFANAHANGDVKLLKEQIVDELAPELIRDYTNGRVDFERKNGTIAKLDYGSLAAAAAKKVAADPIAFMKGKRRLARLRQVAQEKYGQKFDLPSPSDPALARAATKFFPKD